MTEDWVLEPLSVKDESMNGTKKRLLNKGYQKQNIYLDLQKNILTKLRET